MPLRLNFFGVNVGHDPVFRADQIRLAGFNNIRLVMQRRSDVNLGSYIKECHDNGVHVTGQIAKESLWWKDQNREMSPAEAADFYAWTYCQKSSGDLDALSVLNEADGDPKENPESWCLSPQEANVYLAEFLKSVRHFNGDIPLYAVGTVTAQPSYVRALDQSILREYTALDIHAYSQWPNTVLSMIHNYVEFGMKYVVQEFGWPHPDPEERGRYIKSMVQVFESDPDIIGASLYCYDLSQHSEPFGVVDHGVFTSAIVHIQDLGYTGFPVKFPPPVPKGKFAAGLGFEKWGRLEPKIIGEPIGWDETNVAPQWQTQATTNGILSWVGGKGHSFITYPDKEDKVHIYRWEEDWSSSAKLS